MSHLPDRFKDAIVAIIEAIIPERRFLAPAEYRVIAAEGGKLQARPSEASSGYPILDGVPIRGMVAANAGSKLKPGSSVLIGWIAGDRARPYLLDVLESPLEYAIKADAKTSIDAPVVQVNGGAQPVARVGDTVMGVLVITSGNPTFQG